MKPNKERTLTITPMDDVEVTKKQFTCFVHNLSADCSLGDKALIRWERDISDSGCAFFTRGLAKGTFIQLWRKFDESSVEITYSRNGKEVYHAIEANGDINNMGHLAALLHRVDIAVTRQELTQKANADVKTLPHQNPTEPKEYAVNVGDVFRAIDIDELVEKILDQPTILSIGISKSSKCPERQRLESLIRASASYLQHVKRKETGILMSGFSLKHVSDGRRCGHLVTEPMSRIANAYVKIDEDRYYAGLKPAEANLKFATDIMINLLVGI